MSGKTEKCMLVVVLAVMFAVAIAVRISFTDITANENYMEDVYAAELSLGGEVITEMAKVLPDEPYIIVCSPVQDIVYYRSTAYVTVSVSRVIKGEGLSAGDVINISRDGWGLVFGLDLFEDTDQPEAAIQAGFVNVMKPGKEYLVFLRSRVEPAELLDEVYMIDNEDYLITPVFLLEDVDNVIVTPASQEHTYVRYSDVEENEFFAADEDILLRMEQLKEELFNLYGLGES